MRMGAGANSINVVWVLSPCSRHLPEKPHFARPKWNTRRFRKTLLTKKMGPGEASGAHIEQKSDLTTTSDRRNQHNLIPILERIAIAAQKPDVLIVHIHVDELPQLPVFILDLRPERRIAGIDLGQQSRQIGSARSEVLRTIRMPRKRGRQQNLKAHVLLQPKQVLVLLPKLLRAPSNTHRNQPSAAESHAQPRTGRQSHRSSSDRCP